MPKKIKKKEFSAKSVPRIICAAIWYDDKITYNHQPKNTKSGYVLAGRRHHNCLTIQSIISELSGLRTKKDILQGFLTSDDRFVDRAEAGQIAFDAGQIYKPTDCLYSEDLY